MMGDKIEIIKLSRQAGNLLEQGDYKRVVKIYSDALELFSETETTKVKEIKANLFNTIGHAHIKMNDHDNAIVFFYKAADEFIAIEDMQGAGQQLGNIGSVYRDKCEWEDAQKVYNKSLAAFKLVDDKLGIADQYSNIGYICTQKKEYKTALEWFHKARALYEELNIKDKLGQVKKNISILTGFDD